MYIESNSYATDPRVTQLVVTESFDLELTKPDPESVTLAPHHYRIPYRLDDAETKTVEVVLERPHSRSYRLTNISQADALVYAGTEGFAPPMREAFATLATLKTEIGKREQALKQLESERKRWSDDQGRIRSNLSKVPRNSDIHRRYLKRLSDHEQKIENVMGRIDGAQVALDKARNALSDFVQNLEL